MLDDSSTDNTAEKAQLAGVEVIRHNINLRKEAALRTGFALATQNGAKVIVAMKSDGRHDPADIGKLAEPILRGEAEMVKGNYNGSVEGFDVVIGSRFIHGNGKNVPIIRTGTRMARIGRIYTDPCASASTVAPVDVVHTYGSSHTWRSVFVLHQ